MSEVKDNTVIRLNTQRTFDQWYFLSVFLIYINNAKFLLIFYVSYLFDVIHGFIFNWNNKKQMKKIWADRVNRAIILGNLKGSSETQQLIITELNSLK